MENFSNCKKNVAYRIIKLSCPDTKVERRFLELGLIAGQRVRIISKSILKKVFLIEIRGYLLSVKSSLLKCVIVERSSANG